VKVVIVGGGITGLALAHFLEGSLTVRDVTVYERRRRLGGNISTERFEGFTIDAGPDSWVSNKPWATALAREVGLGDELISTNPKNRRVFVAWENKLHPLPEGVVLGVPTKIGPIATTELFTWDAKLRMGLEPLVPRRAFSDEDDDESIASFVGRRLGDQVVERLAGPLLGGIFAGDAEQLSIRATFPQFVDAEREHGSLVRAMSAKRPASHDGASPPSAFTSLKGGLGDLVTTVAHRLRDAEVVTGVGVRDVVAQRDGRFTVVTDAGETRDVDRVAFACAAHAVCDAIRGLAPAVADLLDELRYASTATVFLAYRREHVDHPLDASGFIVPRVLARPMLACTFVSSKWEHRAPAGRALVRVFLGGEWGEEPLRRSDADLVDLACSELGAFLPLKGAPLWSRVFRFDRANPQPGVGHLGRMRRLRRLLEPHHGLYVLGTGYDGVGIPDCVRQAEAAAGAIALPTKLR
jgi:oxygen-dependent protoporphyrinogen oxidase